MTTTEEAKLTEEEFLDAQAAEAHAALQDTWAELKGTLKETASIEVWAKRHPWLVAGAAVAGGFLIATAVFSPPARAPEPAEDVDEKRRQASTGKRHRFSWLLGPFFNLLRPFFGQLVSSLTATALAAFTGAMAANEATEAAADDDAGRSQPGEGPVPL